MNNQTSIAVKTRVAGGGIEVPYLPRGKKG
jgi:hypothetical protein